MDSASLTLPPHLVERIREVLREDVDLPVGLRRQLGDSTSEEKLFSTKVDRQDHVKTTKEAQGDVASEDDGEGELIAPPTIEVELIEELARWAATDQGTEVLDRARLDLRSYSLISLLSGTEVYFPPKKLALLRAAENPEKPNPYLPSHLSPRPPPLAGYRALSRQLSTVLNILFSLFGSGAAVYVAATTGAGYTKETGVILGVLAGCVVGLAEVILVWILVWKVEEGRKKEVEMWKGSAADGVSETSGEELRSKGGDGDGEEKVAVVEEEEEEGSRKVRLRRRALRTSSDQ